MAMASTAAADKVRPMTAEEKKVIFASSLGTVFEWYDFYLYGSLAAIIGAQFFSQFPQATRDIFALLAFAAGFLVRPFGALVFGRVGDLVGRKYTFLVTIMIMGLSTFIVGLLPSSNSIGIAAPIILIVLRMLQGLALGGEYGGAATYVAEHAPQGRRGLYTSWIQTTATLGLFVALGIIMLVKLNMTNTQFEAEWGGWRYPFWISLLLVLVSVIIRMRMSESPMFAKVKSEGKASVNPLKESFGHRANFKMVLVALFGAVMGQGVVWYTGQFYAQSFLENTCKVNFVDSRNILVVAILFATPFFVFFGWLSDRIGRKWIMLVGMLLALFSYRPIYQNFMDYTNPAAKRAMVDVAKTTKSDPTAAIDAKDKKKATVSIKYDSVYTDGAKYSFTKVDTLHFATEYSAKTAAIGYILPNKTDSTKMDTIVAKVKAAKDVKLDEGTTYVAVEKKSAKPGVVIEKQLDSSTFWKIVGWVFILIIFVTMVYGPMAAFLVELFPTKIRYTSMSLPYHIGNGVFGGLVPFLGTLIVEFTKSKELPAGDPLAGLWYPIGVAALCFIIGAIYLRNKIDEDVMD